MKRKIQILLIIVVTISCIYFGINTRKNNAINITQIKTVSEETLSYMIETNKGSIIMIDGGSYDDSEHLEQVLMEKGGVVDSWFVTIAHSQNFGALKNIIENKKVQINHIYVSFNTVEWYQAYEPDRVEPIIEFMELIYSAENMNKVQDIPSRFEVKIDNLNLMALNVKNSDLHGDYAGFNQSMVIKVDNTYKSMIFMGNIADQAAMKFKDNSLDEINCDAVQISNNGDQYVNNEVYKKMTPQYLFIPGLTNGYDVELKNLLKAKECYTSENGDVSIKIW